MYCNVMSIMQLCIISMHMLSVVHSRPLLKTYFFYSKVFSHQVSTRNAIRLGLYSAKRRERLLEKHVFVTCCYQTNLLILEDWKGLPVLTWAYTGLRIGVTRLVWIDSFQDYHQEFECAWSFLFFLGLSFISKTATLPGAIEQFRKTNAVLRLFA